MVPYEPIVGTLYKGTLYRYELGNGQLSDKVTLEHNAQVRHVAVQEDMKAYVLMATEQMIYVDNEDEVTP